MKTAFLVTRFLLVELADFLGAVAIVGFGCVALWLLTDEGLQFCRALMAR